MLGSLMGCVHFRSATFLVYDETGASCPGYEIPGEIPGEMPDEMPGEMPETSPRDDLRRGSIFLR
ncbi:MAG: hypothetical protein WD205_13100 [Rhodothermales bacterium]